MPRRPPESARLWHAIRFQSSSRASMFVWVNSMAIPQCGSCSRHIKAGQIRKRNDLSVQRFWGDCDVSSNTICSKRSMRGIPTSGSSRRSIPDLQRCDYSRRSTGVRKWRGHSEACDGGGSSASGLVPRLLVVSLPGRGGFPQLRSRRDGFSQPGRACACPRPNASRLRAVRPIEHPAISTTSRCTEYPATAWHADRSRRRVREVAGSAPLGRLRSLGGVRRR
jgi:hypothetical protein